MSNYTPTVLLWLRQTEDADRALHVQETLTGLTGVLAVLPSTHNPRLVLVRYDQRQTSSLHLLQVARGYDQSARLVGI